MVLINNSEKPSEDLDDRIKELKQSKKKADEKNQLLHSFLLNDIGSKDLDYLRELLNGQQLIKILAELDDRRQDIKGLKYDLNIKNEELSKLSSQLEYFEKK
ncbi:10764_t:CDS:1, partial [Funneliformis mosseae]